MSKKISFKDTKIPELNSPKEEKLSDERKEEKKDIDSRSIMQSMKTNENGVIIAKDMNEQWQLAKAYVNSGLLPKHFDTPAKVMTAMQYCAELGLHPITGMRQIYIVNGSPSLWGDLPLALCNKSGELEDIDEFLYDKAYNRVCFENKNIHIPLSEIAGAICRVKEKDGNTLKKHLPYQMLLQPDY